MRDRVAHRGPDGARTEIRPIAGDRVLALGHRRLSIIDLTEAAAQPMTRANGALTIVYNGEIYNYVELRAELQQYGAVFQTQSDTEVLLAAYEHWGIECLGRLNGMFAFALWDERRSELFVARDRFGEKPLFFAGLPSGIAVASEIKALLAHPMVSADVNEAVVDRYATGAWYEDGDETFFRSVVRLPPAQAMTIDASGSITRRWRYWTPDYSAVQERYEEGAAVERFRALLERSLHLRLRSDVPIGTSLSGGLDSSTIVCLLSRLGAEAPMLSQNTFSGRFEDDPTISEGPLVDIVAHAAAVNAFHTTADPLRLADESARVHWHQEEPFLSASIYLQWCVMRLAREHETTVLLDGQGADEVLAGYQPYFRTHQLDLLDRGELARLARETRAFSGHLRTAGRPYADVRRRFDPNIALSLRHLARLALRRPGVYSGDYAVGVPPAIRGARLRRQLAEALQYNSLPMLLRYADRNAMAFGRETRFPYLDHELVDWCIGLPDEALIHDGWQKFILRRAAEGVVPSEVQWRADKVGYAAPLDIWLRGPLRQWAHERLFHGSITDLDSYDYAAVRALWEQHQAGGAENSWALWRWISLNEWFALLESGAWKRGLSGSGTMPAEGWTLAGVGRDA